MIVRYLGKDRKFHKCECRDRKCPKRPCFSPGHAVHASPGAYNGAWRDNKESCVYRDYHGCPDKAEGGKE